MAKEKLYLVVKSKDYYGNVLGYNLKTSEYVYFYFGREVWRVKASRDLFDYCNSTDTLDYDKCKEFEVYRKYEESCDKRAFIYDN